MHFHTILQIAIEDFVALFKRTSIDVVQLPNGFLDGNSRKGRIDAPQCIGQNPWQKNVSIAVIGALNIGAVKMLIPELLYQMLNNDVFEESFIDLNHSVPKLSHRVLLTLTRVLTILPYSLKD